MKHFLRTIIVSFIFFNYFQLLICQESDSELSEVLLSGTQAKRIEKLDYKNLCKCQCKDFTVFVKERNR